MLNIFRRESDEYYLFEAVRKNSIGALRKAIKSIANIDATDDTGKTALWVAAKLGHVEAAKMLIEAGANVNFRYSDGRTPIFPCIEADNLAMVRLLVDSGADLSVHDGAGYTPHSYASERSLSNILDRVNNGGRAD